MLLIICMRLAEGNSSKYRIFKTTEEVNLPLFPATYCEFPKVNFDNQRVRKNIVSISREY